MEGDWQTRKRLKSSDSSDCSSASSTTADQIIAGDPADEDEDVEQPFAFASHRRCAWRAAWTMVLRPPQLPPVRWCCGFCGYRFGGLGGGHDDTSAIHVHPNAVFFLPPPCEVAWFSGICAAGSQRHTGISFDDSDDDDDDGGDTSADESTEVSSLLKLFRGPLSLLAHESEIDDCLKCIRGYHFRVSVTDSARKMRARRSLSAREETCCALNQSRGHGTADRILTTQSFAGAETVTPLIERFFPSVLRRLSGPGPPRASPSAWCALAS